MSSCISAIGTANPQYKTSQKTIYNFMVGAFGLNENNASRLKQIYDHSGIDYRYSVIPDFGEHRKNNHTFFANTPTMEPFPGTSQRLKIYQNEAINIATTAAKNCLKSLSKDLTKN